jgi:hypothetical protein
MQIVEPDEVDILAFTVARDLQQIGDAEESGLACEFRRDLRYLNGFHGVDLDLAFVHTIAPADLNVGTSPDPNAAGNLPPADCFAKAFREDHVQSLHPVQWNAGSADCDESNLT